jgi:hypothetical protein
LKKPIKAFALTASIFVAGCMTAGNRFDVSKVNQLKPGFSTTADAIQLLGPARSESNYPDGSKLP